MESKGSSIQRLLGPLPRSSRGALRCLSVLLLAGAVGCGDGGPVAPWLSPDEDRAARLDGSSGGNPHFFFLPPVAPERQTNGTFNPRLSPVVEICTEYDAQRCLAEPLVRFPQGGKTGKDRLRAREGHYTVTWHTAKDRPDYSETHRVFVRLRGIDAPLGYADVRFSSTATEVSLDAGYVIVPSGSTLPIQFRVEDGAVLAALFPAGGGDEEFVCNDCVEATVTSTDTTTVAAPSGDAGAFFPAGAIPAEVGEVTVVINQVEPTAEQPCLPGGQPQAGECYTFETYPYLADGFATDSLGNQIYVTVGTCIDPALREQYQLAKYSEERPEEGVVVLDPAPAPFLDCTTIAFENSASPLARLAGRGLAGLGRAFLPALAYAGDTGYGGTTDAFSTVGWVMTLEMQKVESTDSQTAVAGSTLPVEPSVRVLSAHELEHGDTVPASGVEVTFSVATGGGVLGPSRTIELKDTTDAEGYASVSWHLGLALGAQSITAMIPDAPTATGTDTLTATFTATAEASGAVQSTESGPLAAGYYHTCALRGDGTAVCWGGNFYGQRNVPAGETFAQLSAGFSTTCGLRGDGTVTCYGSDGSGQTDEPAGPFSKVSAGGYAACALRTDSTVACWGSTAYGQLDLPVDTYSEVAQGHENTCAVRTDGTIVCVGRSYGPGGLVPPSGAFAQVAASGDHFCALGTDGTLACWGSDQYGQLTGIPTGTFTQVSAGNAFTCALRSDGTIACWGQNLYGETLPPTGSFVRISLGAYHACAQRADNTIACWGLNDHGQIDVPLEFR